MSRGLRDPSEEQTSRSDHGPSKNPYGLYDIVADTIGMVPSRRKKENRAQAIIVGLGTAIAFGVGFLRGGFVWAMIYSVYVLWPSLFLTGGVLMVIGWVRAIRAIRKRRRESREG